MVPCLLAFTFPGACAGRRSLKVLLAYLVPVISPLRVTVKVPLEASPASNVPEIVSFAPPPATFWLGVAGPSTYRPILSCISPVRAEITTDEPETTWPSAGEVICPEEFVPCEDDPARPADLAVHRAGIPPEEFAIHREVAPPEEFAVPRVAVAFEDLAVHGEVVPAEESVRRGHPGWLE